MNTKVEVIAQQSSTRPPAQPTYILRGHTAQIHAVHFFRHNTRIVTGDADGWVILWSLPLKRPVAVWRAHTSTVLGLTAWTDEKIITHGRDGKLCVWQLREDDEPGLSTVLPVDDAENDRKAPWLLHSILVHALNFCSFASCALTGIPEDSLLIAVSGVQDGSIIVMSLPDEARMATIPPPQDVKTGMLMAIGLHLLNGTNYVVLAGYESGHVAAWTQSPDKSKWQIMYMEQAHSQPVMSLDVAHEMRAFFTSSADAIIARHSIQDGSLSVSKTQTKHAGQQSLRVRSDEKIFATAGWDGRARVYSTKTLKELAVLKWHKEGCYALDFAPLEENKEETHSLVKMTMSDRRLATAKATHWLAAGSKDGKVSLWEIY